MGRREEHALKQLLRITILLIGLIWILAWAAAGRFDGTPNTQDGSESPLPSGEIAAPGERDSAKTLRVQIQGEVQEMDMGTYLLGVLRAEMPASFEEEALKAQAIAARTYTLYRIRGGGSANHPDADACDDHTCCKAYLSAEQAAANWGSMAVYYEEKLARMAQLKQYALEQLLTIDGVVRIGNGDAPHILSVSLVGYPSANVVTELGAQGICISAGSACHRGKLSHVYAAMKLDKRTAAGVLRVSFAPETTKTDVDALVSALRRHRETRFPML